SPADGATVASSVSVTATATDNVSVTKVEFYLDGVLTATDTSTPYSWSWDTTTAANGGHTLLTKAYDPAGNTGSSATGSVTVSNAASQDLSGWRIVQANASYTFALPANTSIPANGYVVIARNATKSAFEAFWHVTLPANAVYINSAGAFPVINGSENYTLYN